jgi:hypothetical protein
MKKLQKILYSRNIFWALLLFVAVACTPQLRFSVETLPEYEALFQNREGWTGGDGVYSIALSNKKILWLFGDTWIGEIRDGRHVNATIVNNSLALQSGRKPQDAFIDYYYRLTPEGEPAAFFQPPEDGSWFWIYHGVITARGLYLFLMQIERTGEPSVFGFKLTGSWLARIVNPHDPPLAWRIYMEKIPWETISSSRNVFFGSSLLKKSNFVYIYGIMEEIGEDYHRKYMILARVPEVDIDDFYQWRFLTDQGWSSSFTEAAKLCGRMANEYAVSFQPALQQYIAVYSDGGISRDLVARTAPEPEGPWSDPNLLYQCPEAKWHENFFCYAAKAHPAVSPAFDELIVSYVANSTDFEQMAADTRIYRPRFLRVRFKAARPK